MTSIQDSYLKRVRTNTNFTTSFQLAVRTQIIREAHPLLKGHIKSREIWHALQVADYKKDGMLNEHALRILFERQGHNLKELLQVKNPEELLELLDEKGLGFISEDEQILMFSVIKERMAVCASELCKIYEYALEKEMLSAVKCLETDIVEYQNVLRKRTYEKELEAYRQIGVDKLESFEQSWQEQFDKNKKICQEKLERLSEEQAKELLLLEDELQKDLNAVRVKPKIAMKDMQIQEKLFAYNDRFAEAHQIRNELSVFELSESKRVENKIIEQQDKKRNLVLRRQENALNQQKLKNEELENKLKIKYEHEKSRLEKEIKLHYNDIAKNHCAASNIAIKKGKFRDELRRIKQNARNLQFFIKDMKTSKTPKVASEKIFKRQLSFKARPNVLRMTMSLANSPVMGYKGFQINTGVLTRFGIRSDAVMTDRPVNVQPEYLSSFTFASRTGKLLENSNKKKNLLPSVAELYNDNLEPIA